jgi:hypothetical protein
VILNYLTDIIGTLTKDLLGLHPWVFYFHLLSLRHTFRGIFAGLSQKPSGGPRLVED